MKTLTRQYLTMCLLASLILSGILLFSIKPAYAFFLGMNVVSFTAMGIDKKAAGRQQQRIPENVFIILALLGAGTGILFATLLFRHKIRKRFFFTTISSITVLYGLVAKIIIEQ